jgi:hypothetical protein
MRNPQKEQEAQRCQKGCLLLLAHLAKYHVRFCHHFVSIIEDPIVYGVHILANTIMRKLRKKKIFL